MITIFTMLHLCHIIATAAVFIVTINKNSVNVIAAANVSTTLISQGDQSRRPDTSAFSAFVPLIVKLAKCSACLVCPALINLSIYSFIYLFTYIYFL